MDKIDKAIKLITENKHLDGYHLNTYNYSFKYNGKPESYSRERKGRGSHFYNPKGDKIREYRRVFKTQLNDDSKKYLSELISSPEKIYMVYLDITYAIQVQKADSIKNTALKLAGIIKPSLRPDIDNYDKFILDAMHDVIYDDDKRVISIRSNKIYAEEEYTLVNVKIEEIIKE